MTPSPSPKRSNGPSLRVCELKSKWIMCECTALPALCWTLIPVVKQCFQVLQPAQVFGFLSFHLVYTIYQWPEPSQTAGWTNHSQFYSFNIVKKNTFVWNFINKGKIIPYFKIAHSIHAVDGCSCVILVLLNLSAAFDTVDHEILLHRLEKRMGMTGSLLLWFKSYQSSHTHRVYIKGTSSDDHPLKYGVHQGPILGLKLFKIYTLPVGDITHCHGLQYQIYADNNDLYIAFKSRSHKDHDTFNRSIANIKSCILDIRSWMATNFLINNLKTELLLIGSCYGALVPCSHIQIGNEQVPPSIPAQNLGVNFDSGMTLETHVNSVVSAAFYHIKNIGSIRNHLAQEVAVTLVHAHVTSRLDYCNALLYGLSDKILYKV